MKKYLMLTIIFVFFAMININSIEAYTKKTTLQVQSILKEKGYNVGKIDGIWGKKTRAALKNFQRKNSLKITAKLDNKTKFALGIYQVYSWKDLSENRYITIIASESINPNNIFKNNSIAFIPEKKLLPIKIKPDYKAYTYRLVKIDRTNTSIYSISSNPKVIYLIGETHLGKSQKEVVKILQNLFQKHEIDAVFLEQPDKFQFNWSNYKNLEKEPLKAIKVLEENMINNSEMSFSYNFGIYQKYFDNGDPSTKDGLMEISNKILEDYGESGLIEVNRIIEEQSERVKTSNNIYKNSKYISAADYFYIMLNLKGINIPFHNVESKKLRDKFEKLLYSGKTSMDSSPEPKLRKELYPRDNYMTKKIDSIIKNEGYNQCIMICGALHLGNLKHKLSKKGYHVIIAYNSMVNKQYLKQEMAILKNPEHIISLVENSFGSGLITSKYSIENLPSKDLISNVNEYFKANKLEDRDQLLANFTEKYNKNNLKSKPKWDILIPLKNKNLIITKNSSSNTIKFSIASQEPLEPKLLNEFKSDNLNLNISDVDYKNINRLGEINSLNSGTLQMLTIENKISHYEVYGDNFIPIYKGNNIADLYEVINNSTTNEKALYLDMKNFKSDKIELFSNTLKVQNAKNNSNFVIKTFPHTQESISFQDAFFKKGKIEITNPPKTIKSEIVKSGKYKGWFNSTIDFIINIGNTTCNLSMRILSKTISVPKEFISLLQYKLSSSKFEGSVAKLINNIRWELKTKHNYNDEEIAVELKDQYGNYHFVLIKETKILIVNKYKSKDIYFRKL